MTKPEKTAFERLPRWKQKVIDLIVQGEKPTHAVRKVKPMSKRPEVMASKLRYEPLYVEALEERRAEAVKEAGIANNAVLLALWQFANGDSRACTWQAHEALPEGAVMGQRKKLHELDDATARCVEPAVSSKDGGIDYRWPSRVQAARLLGQALKMFTESHEINFGEATLEQLAAQSWNKPKADDASPVSDS